MKLMFIQCILKVAIIKQYNNIWRLQKEKHPIGEIVEGKIKYFYPQGIIIQIGDTLGVYQQHESKVNVEYGTYPLDIIKGKVKGYDEKNMWLVIS